MGQTLRPYIEWATSTGGTVTLLIFILGCLVSLYPEQIKRFLHEWPFTRKMYRKYRFNVAKHKLQELEYLHDNAYRLNLHVFGALVLLFISAVGISLFLALMTSLTTHSWPNMNSFGAVFFGMLISKSLNLARVFHDLSDLENAKRRFQSQMLKNIDMGGTDGSEAVIFRVP